MHWSEKGLKSMLALVLVRYTDPMRYEEFMERLLASGRDLRTVHNTGLTCD